MMNCRLKQNAFGRWILVHEVHDNLAWTGATWALVDARGLPGWRVQVSNLASPEEAAEYAKQHGLSVIAEVQ